VNVARVDDPADRSRICRMPLTVGTAGHVDHGKTWLVRALTGKDTDRLPEERARGLSIDLGYAPLDLPDGRRLSLIDVPGHERFVRQMVAGASGIDLFLLVIDAGEGARPQTHEHLEILRLLGVERGVVAVTKVDAVLDGRAREAVAEAAELVPAAEVYPVSAKTGAGLGALREAIARVADGVELRDARDLPPRLWVDRAFTIPGAGTVATGTLWSGSIGAGDRLRVEPGGRDVRVRTVEVHDARVERARAGQRVAVALPGVERAELPRGVALVEPGAYPVSYRLDVVLEGGEVPASVEVLIGTAALPGRVIRRGNYAQLRLSGAVAAFRGDRFVFRAAGTVGGGRVLDPTPPRKLDAERLELLEGGDPVSIVTALTREPQRIEALSARGVLAPAELGRALAGLARSDNWYFRPEWLSEIQASVRQRLEARREAEPLDPGLPIGRLLPDEPWTTAVLPLLALERRDGKAYLPGASPALGSRADDASALEAELERAGVAGARVPDAGLGRYLEREGRLVRLGDGTAVSAAAYEAARRTLVDECEHAGSITLARFRDLLGSSRKPAQLLLERFDADGLTRRIGDERVLRRRARG
jgi:selenocysteine-specific elongation factor